jgi:hypothetical protein
MKTHCLIFLAIGDLVSPIELPFPDKCGGGLTRPCERKIFPFSTCSGTGPSSRGLLCRSCHARHGMFTPTWAVN